MLRYLHVNIGAMIKISDTNVRICELYYEPPKAVNMILSDGELARLRWLMHKSPMQVMPGGSRIFVTDIGKTIDYLYSIDFFHRVLKKDVLFSVTGGNYFYTTSSYRIHADTGQSENEFPYKVIVIPLDLTGSGRSTLHVLNQRWYNQAAFFLKGGDQHQNDNDEYNICVYDYSDVVNLDTSGIDPELLAREFSHINPQNFDGLSILSSFDWIIGGAMVFDRSHLHVSNNFRQTGIKSKIGLSLFLSINN
jgi:hypothetical protein